jgi:hypothetical protein
MLDPKVAGQMIAQPIGSKVFAGHPITLHATSTTEDALSRFQIIPAQTLCHIARIDDNGSSRGSTLCTFWSADRGARTDAPGLGFSTSAIISPSPLCPALQAGGWLRSKAAGI